MNVNFRQPEHSGGHSSSLNNCALGTIQFSFVAANHSVAHTVNDIMSVVVCSLLLACCVLAVRYDRVYTDTYRAYVEPNRHLHRRCFIYEITNVNRFIHRHSAAANEYKLSATTLCVSIRSEFIIKFSMRSGRRRRCQQSLSDCIHYPTIHRLMQRKQCTHTQTHQTMTLFQHSNSDATTIVAQCFHTLQHRPMDPNRHPILSYI